MAAANVGLLPMRWRHRQPAKLIFDWAAQGDDRAVLRIGRRDG